MTVGNTSFCLPLNFMFLLEVIVALEFIYFSYSASILLKTSCGPRRLVIPFAL